MSEKMYPLPVWLIRQTEKAFFVKPPVGERFWVPKQLCADIQDVIFNEGQKYLLSVPVWFMKKNNYPMMAPDEQETTHS